jgi:hypothetical protein
MYSPTEIDDVIEMRGRVRLQLIRPDGSEEIREVDNLVVTSGKNFIASRMKDAVAAVMSHMAVGTGGTAPAVADVALVAEVARVPLGSTAVAGAVVTYTASFGAGVGTGALVEAGIFNAAAAGNMLNRTTYAVINKGAPDILNVTWTVTVG